MEKLGVGAIVWETRKRVGVSTRMRNRVSSFNFIMCVCLKNKKIDAGKNIYIIKKKKNWASLLGGPWPWPFPPLTPKVGLANIYQRTLILKMNKIVLTLYTKNIETY